MISLLTIHLLFLYCDIGSLDSELSLDSNSIGYF